MTPRTRRRTLTRRDRTILPVRAHTRVIVGASQQELCRGRTSRFTWPHRTQREGQRRLQAIAPLYVRRQEFGLVPRLCDRPCHAPERRALLLFGAPILGYARPIVFCS